MRRAARLGAAERGAVPRTAYFVVFMLVIVFYTVFKLEIISISSAPQCAAQPGAVPRTANFVVLMLVIVFYTVFKLKIMLI